MRKRFWNKTMDNSGWFNAFFHTLNVELLKWIPPAKYRLFSGDNRSFVQQSKAVTSAIMRRTCIHEIVRQHKEEEKQAIKLMNENPNHILSSK